jgi:hypothetical protein
VLAFDNTPEFGTATFSNANKTADLTAGEVIVRVTEEIIGKKLIAFHIDASASFTGIGFFCPRAAAVNGIGKDSNVSAAWLSNNSIAGLGGNAATVPWPGVGGDFGVVVDETWIDTTLPAQVGCIWATPNGTDFYGKNGAGTLTRADVEASLNGCSLGPWGQDPAGVFAAVGMAYGGPGGKLTILDAWPWADVAGYDYLSGEPPEPDTDAPVLSAATGTETGSFTATLTVSTTEANGMLYGSSSTVAPTKAQIKAGQSSTGAASIYAFNQVVGAVGVQTKNATGLTHSQTYTMHYMHEDAAGNQSNIASAAPFTTDTADILAPVLSSPTGVETGTTTATLTVSTDEANGTLYGVNDSSAPSKAQIKAGHTQTDAVSTYAFNQPVTTTGVQTHNATGLAPGTNYMLHYMHEDVAGNQSEVASTDVFTTDAGTSALVFNTTPVFGTAPTFSNGNKTMVAVGDCTIKVSQQVLGKKLIAFRLDSAASPSYSGAIGIYSPHGSGAPANPIGQETIYTVGFLSNGSNSGFTGGVYAESFTWPAIGQPIGLILDETGNRLWVTPNGSNYYGVGGAGALTKPQVEAGISGNDMTFWSDDAAGLFVAVGQAFTGSGAGVTILDSWPWTPITGYTYLG